MGQKSYAKVLLEDKITRHLYQLGDVADCLNGEKFRRKFYPDISQPEFSRLYARFKSEIQDKVAV
jgi:hypothetical protein